MLTPGFSSTAKTRTPANVIVIGAGMAGITATNRLLQEGFRVTLIDARNEVGGRARNTLIGQTELPLGPAWVHGVGQGSGRLATETENPILPMLREAHLKTHTFTRIDPNAVRLSEDFPGISLIALLRIYEVLETGTEQEKQEIHQQYFKGENSHELEKWLQRIVDCVTMTSEGVSKEDSDASIAQYTNGIIEQHCRYEGEDLFICEGYSKLIRHLLQKAQKTGALTLVLDEPVITIDCTDDTEKKSKVITQKKSYEGDFVICTLPLGVLRQNSVQIPGLSDAKKHALESLQIARNTRVFLEFNQHFWDNNADNLVILNPNPTQQAMVHYVNTAKYSETKAPILLASFYGDQEAGKSEVELIEIALAPLKRCYAAEFQAAQIKLVSWKVQDWANDPYARGCWALPGANTLQADLDALLEPECHNRLFFAGEHIVPILGGNVHGAYKSGVLAAERLIAAPEVNSRIKPN